MSFHVRSFEVVILGKPETVLELSDAAGTVRAEVWPSHGFNCLKWQVRRPDGEWGDILYHAPDWLTNPVATRSGHPILFPFPNRMTHGRFTFEGNVYQLPLNESTGTHAIHGFTPKNRWEVGATESEEDSCSVTGSFMLSRDFPAGLDCWPTDLHLSVKYVLSADSLTVVTTVENQTQKNLPFGLGFHPYFRHPLAPDATADELILSAPLAELWESDAGIPNGRRLPVPAELDFTKPRPVGSTQLDTLFRLAPQSDDHLGHCVAQLGHPTAPGTLSVWVDEAFRELLLFTPPHRKAVAIEPYTCASDAANLHARGIDAGWRTLPPDSSEVFQVDYRWEPA